MVDKITNPPSQKELIDKVNELVDDKQDTLVSGTNIKTINNTSILGSGNIDIQGGADVDLSNITSTGKNIANWSTNVSNCITEIPQDIKLELNNGTLTLKAGSKVYVPNGAGVFDKVTISTDINYTAGYNDTRMLFVQGSNHSGIDGFPVTQCYSGNTAPTGSTYMYWYDTANNIIKRTVDGGSTWVSNSYSLPICIVTGNNSVVTSIDQVFNGFGYIGSTVFALPGVKGLIPNGRNADGTLKNIEFVTDKVIIRTITWNNSAGQELFIGKYTINNSIEFISTSRIGQYYQQEDEPSLIKYAMWYKPSENKMYRCDNSGGNLIWKNCFPCYLGQWFTSGTSPYPITELTTKLSFRAVDYNDLTTITTNSNARNIGEIITSSIPLNDAGLHLLDGALISGSGSYADFVTYISGLVSAYPDLFETEANWQTSVTNYGVCGKFVYDSQNNTVRLPKITGFTEGTTDVTALGDLIQAGLPNITATGTIGTIGSHARPTISGAFVNLRNGSVGSDEPNTTGWLYDLDASRSSSIYGNSSTVQPQSIKVLYYIVVANSTKTDIEVDIDEIVTDLNGKADTDLSNCTKPHIVETYVNGTSWYRVYSDGWCEQGGEITIQAQGANTGILTTVTFLKPYQNTNYYVAPITYITDGGNTIGLRNNHTDKNTTFMNISTYSTAAISNSYIAAWYTSGYIS